MRLRSRPRPGSPSRGTPRMPLSRSASSAVYLSAWSSTRCGGQQAPGAFSDPSPTATLTCGRRTQVKKCKVHTWGGVFDLGDRIFANTPQQNVHL